MGAFAIYIGSHPVFDKLNDRMRIAAYSMRYAMVAYKFVVTVIPFVPLNKKWPAPQSLIHML